MTSHPQPLIALPTTNVLLTKMYYWVQHKLPKLNNAIENGQNEPNALVAEFQPLWNEIGPHLQQVVNQMECHEARMWIQLIGFVVSSLEKHLQSRQNVAGTGLRKIRGVERMLLQLGVVAKHPPRDSHYTYWIWNNRDQPLLFTGDPQEAVFNKIVNQTDALHSESCRALRPICRGVIDISSPLAIAGIQQSTVNMQKLHKVFRSFMERNTLTDQRNMEPVFFMTRMRTYLPTYPVEGISWGGVNAANLASQMQVDYLVGAVNPEYAHVVNGRLRYMTAEDQENLKADMLIPSIMIRLLDRLDVTSDFIINRESADLTRWLSFQPISTQNVVVAYCNLIKAAGQLSAIHWSLIQNYLVKPVHNLTVGQRGNFAVDPSVGTGGKTHEETQGIMKMRREHPVAAKLIHAIEQTMKINFIRD